MSHLLRRTSARMSPRVVFNTNVVISALVFGGGIPAQLRHAWQSGACQPLVSTATAQELIRVLAYPKFRLSANAQHELLADYLPYAVSVQIPKPAPTAPSCRDPFDLPFLHLAIAGRAAALVSGDRGLLVLADELPCAVLGPAAFLATLQAR